MNSNSFNKNDLKDCYDQYFDAIRNYIFYKVKDVALAEDIVQETFIKLWKSRETVRKETVKSLLYTIAGNTVINHFNHMKVVRNHENEVITTKGRSSGESPLYLLEEKEFQLKLNAIIEMIPEGSREVFLMNRIEQLKYSEIAERLELSVKAVEKRMSKALVIIREQLGRKI
ncbi:MAG: RNA polymerase sigma-70 factor [Cyclobacteriaceae bacterium]